jgi:uncharacterized membrane protein YqaE (UPF0057 family)
MKTSNYILFIVVASFLFASCGSLSISQKRYSRGLNIDWFSAKGDKKTQAATTIKVKKTPSKKQDEAPVKAEEAIAENQAPVETQAEIIVAVPDQVSVETVKAETVEVPKQRPAKKIAKQLKAMNKIRQEMVAGKLSIAQSRVDKNTPDASTNDSDVALILLVILALLLPPLAVFLYFGEANGHFWLNLILWLIAIGAIFGGLAFGFAVPVIHALLVVFGIFG